MARTGLAMMPAFPSFPLKSSQYTLSRTTDDTGGLFSLPANNYDLRGERGLADFDRRHKLDFAGTYEFPRDVKLSAVVNVRSGTPFNITTGSDDNHDTVANDRPAGIGRNTGRGEAFYSFDLRLARRFFVKENRFLEITVEGFNLFNRTNFQGINNIIGGACVSNGLPVPCTAGATPLTDFNLRGRADQAPTSPLGFTSASDPRQLQLGARFNF